MALISVVIKALETADFAWGKPHLTELLERERIDGGPTEKRCGDRLVRDSIKDIARWYDHERTTLWRTSREVLDPARFFKNQSFVSSILDDAPGRESREAARTLVRDP